MLAPLDGPLIVTQLFASHKGGPGEAYTAFHGGLACFCGGHAGVDLEAAPGTPVRAMKSGTAAVYAPASMGLGLPDDGYGIALGLHVVIRLPSGEEHWYAHLSSALVGNEDTVDAGKVIALSGFSGNVSPPGPEGAHLHVAVRPPNPDFGSYDGFIEWTAHLDHTIQRTRLVLSGV